jgi:hypothetical protein
MDDEPSEQATGRSEPDVERDVLGLMLRSNSQLLADRLAARPGPGTAEGSPLSALAAARNLGSVLEDIVLSLVRQARAEGSSWGAVGYALGVTRQAAFQRFGYRSGEQPVTQTSPLADAGQRARKALRQFLDGDFGQLREGFDVRMTGACGVELLQTVRSQLSGALGEELKTGDPQVSLRMGYTVVDTPLSSPKGSYKARFAFDADGQVAGFFVLTPETL